MAEGEIMNSDLEDQFADATKYLESVAAGMDSSQLLEFYSYYKQATQGRCNTVRPSWFNMTARQKWDAWNALQDLSQEDAMRKYIMLLTQLFPNWKEHSNDKYSTSGWVAVSTMPKEDLNLEDSEKEFRDWIREGNKVKIKQLIENNNINQLDSEGLGPIHWAADQGDLDMLRFLVFDLRADVNLKDKEGQTALHYAVCCSHKAIVQYLLDSGADKEVPDENGATPLSIALELEDSELANMFSN